MRNLTLTNLYITLMVFAIFVKNGFNVNASTIEATLQRNIHDKELIARQQPETISCSEKFDDIRKSTAADVGIPENTIITKLTMECNSKLVRASVNSYGLRKYIDNRFVDIKGVTMKPLEDTAIPKNIGWFIIGRYLLSADPSECLNAPQEGLYVSAHLCVSVSEPGYEESYDVPCTTEQNFIQGCPPNSKKPDSEDPDSENPDSENPDSENPDAEDLFPCYNNTSSTISSSTTTSSPSTTSSPLYCTPTKLNSSSSPFSPSSFLAFFPFVFSFISFFLL
ncbi:3812_t:CDS:1 [Ambispora gerdemannii]|uniref:3812_t:CDS:1 n=1 Tax=Ambispora gerdemannii TaxID=144530 RepID=A0A9N9AM99_9GLOM|nr:3812_t:CDS:1 [Ambispora gerdemannii]